MEEIASPRDKKEIAYVLVGETKSGIILAKMMWKSRGSESSVLFDGVKVLAREESDGDVVGFFHTHPEGFAQPSNRDDDTMLSWSFCFGKPLLCVIATKKVLRAWLYDADSMTSSTSCDAKRKEVKNVDLFKSNRLVAVLPDTGPGSSIQLEKSLKLET